MQLDPFVVILFIKLDILNVVFTALSHHVLVVELLVNSLVHKAGFSHCRFSCDDYSRS